MTHKERMLAALQGQPSDRIPWAPRLDLWYRANKRADALPDKYRNATLTELVDDVGMGFHAIIPDFKDLRSLDDEVDRALGIFDLRTMPYRTVLENVERRVRVDGDRTIVAYATPVGRIETVVLYDESMREAGVSITHIESHAFKTPEDYAALGYIFENARVEPNYDGYAAFAEGIGERGLAAAYIGLAASPTHYVMRDFMPLDTFFYEMHDHPDEFRELVRCVGLYYEQLLGIACDCPAEVFLVGANYDASVTYPPFFVEYIQPWLKQFAGVLHAEGKYLLTHADGENTGLLQHYLDAEIDIADSICPKPMTRLSFKQVRDAFGGKITIMGGIPSVTLLPRSMSERDFEAFLDGFFDDIGGGDHLILGISDTTPPQADFNRILKIAERVAAFGPVGPS